MSEWKMVPVEPTDEMSYTGATAMHNGQNAADVYRALLAAAPAPAFDEAAERAACTIAWESSGLGAACMAGFWYGYLACAKRKARAQ